MKHRSLALLGLLLCAACGGHSNRAEITSEHPEVADGGSAGSEASPESGGVPESAPEAGGAGLSRAGAMSGDSDADAGAPGYVPTIDSGTRWCQEEDTCFGLECYAPADFQPSVCVAPCQTDDDCLPSEACIKSAGLAPTCYARCDSPSDCDFHFDCFDFSGAGQFVCFPTTWAGRRRELD